MFAAILLSLALQDDGPQIVKCHPQGLLVKSEPSIVILNLTYSFAWPDGISAQDMVKRMKVYTRRDGAPEEQRISEISRDLLQIQFNGSAYVKTAGTVEAFIKIDGVCSNFFQIAVVTGAASITSLSKEKIVIGDDADDPRFEFEIRARNLDTRPEVYVGGKIVRSYLLRPGVLLVSVPRSLRDKPDRLAVTINTLFHSDKTYTSEPAYLTLERPPMDVKPGGVGPAKIEPKIPPRR